jgi:cysteine desulfurase/selenocysteine lyase
MALRGLVDPAIPSVATRGFDVDRVRQDFPILTQLVHGRALVYLDNAATAQKPQAVIDAMGEFLACGNANVHRGVHDLSQRASARYDGVRAQARRFLNAERDTEIVFTSGTTASINLVAQSYGGSVLRPGDEILLTEMEHHSNIVPWQLIQERTGAIIRVAPVSGDGRLPIEAVSELITKRTRIVALTHASNVLGTVNPVRPIADLAHAVGAVVLVDGAQSVPHLPVDIRALGCDFFVCSGHKMYGPTGVGILYGREDLLERMPPWQGGGGMIATVTFEKSTYAPVPARFEAGTPPIAEVIGLGAAMEYLGATDAAALQSHEDQLTAYALDGLGRVPGIRLMEAGGERVGVVSLVMDGVHPHDIGTVLDLEGVAIRAGHHCAQPLMRRLGVPATARASFGLYNTVAEVDALIAALHRVRKVFG